MFAVVWDQIALLIPQPVPPPVSSTAPLTTTAPYMYQYDPAILEDESCAECGDNPCEHEIPTQYDVHCMDPAEFLSTYAPLDVHTKFLNIELCAQCHELRHLQVDCPLQYNWHYMMKEEQEAELEACGLKCEETNMHSAVAQPLAQHAESAKPTPPQHPKPTAKQCVEKPQMQTANPALSANRFATLEVETVRVMDTADEKPPPPPPAVRKRIPKWERRLPKSYIVATMPGPRSLHLKVELQTTDMGKVLATNTLLDCGTTSLFIDMEYMCAKCLTIRTLVQPVPVYNVDGSLNKAGAITGIMDLILCYNSHTEHAQFAVTKLRKQDVILGYTWLRKHNPEVNWQTNKVKMSHCPAKCCTCTNEEKAEQQKNVRKLIALPRAAWDPSPPLMMTCTMSQTLRQILMTTTSPLTWKTSQLRKATTSLQYSSTTNPSTSAPCRTFPHALPKHSTRTAR